MTTLRTNSHQKIGTQSNRAAPQKNLTLLYGQLNHQSCQSGLGVHNRWYKNITIKDKICTPKLELLLLVVSWRPYVLPHEIPCVIFIIVYLLEGHHTQSENITIDVISNVQKDKPEAAIIVLGDFNNQEQRFNFKQYVNCTTKHDRTINLCYCNIKNPYNKSLKIDPLGLSDHNNILLPTRVTSKLKQVKYWNTDIIEQIQDCFHITN